LLQIPANKTSNTGQHIVLGSEETFFTVLTGTRAAKEETTAALCAEQAFSVRASLKGFTSA
jgi:hypothetical protein